MVATDAGAAMFDWDDANIEHLSRHGVEPKEAEEALLDPRRLGVPAYNVAGEKRQALLDATEDGGFSSSFILAATMPFGW